MIWSVTSQKVGCTLETSANQRHIRQWDNWNLVQFPGWVTREVVFTFSAGTLSSSVWQSFMSSQSQWSAGSSSDHQDTRTDMKLLDERILSLFKRHWRQTLTYWSVFFSFGLCIAFLGPTILDLRCQTQSTLQQITWVFFSQQFFLLVGSGLGGRFKKTWV